MKDNAVLFRFHRGGLSESMETVIEIKSFEHLLIHICDTWDVPFTRLIIQEYLFDPRIDWDTQLVSAYLGGVKHPIGYLNKNPGWKVSDYE